MSTHSADMDSEASMLHPEFLSDHDHEAIYRGERRLDHAEGSSKPLRS